MRIIVIIMQTESNTYNIKNAHLYDVRFLLIELKVGPEVEKPS